MSRSRGAASATRDLRDQLTVAGFKLGWRALRELPEPLAYGLFNRIADVAVRRGGNRVERLRAKDTDGRVAVTIGDMATTRVEGSFGLVYLVYNGIGNLTTQDRQVACFANAAAHLGAGGVFWSRCARRHQVFRIARRPRTSGLRSCSSMRWAQL